MKSRILTTLVLIFSFWLQLRADEKITFRYIDSLSYQLYINQKWDSLSIIGKLALKNGIDYYYLRMRLGTADFQLEKYISATTDFKKALVFNNHSISAKSYLYFSQLYSGKKTMAYRYSRVFTAKQKERLGVKISTFESLGILGGYSFSDNYNKNGNINLLTDGASLGEQLLIGNMVIGSLGFSLNFSPTVSLNGSINYENVEKRNRYQYILEKWDKQKFITGPNGSYRNDFRLKQEEAESTFDSFINQIEFYLNAKVQLDDGWSFNLFTNILYLNLTQYDALLTSTIRQDTLSYNGMTGNYQYVNLEEPNYLFMETDTSFVNYVAGFNLQKDFNFIVFDFTTTFSKLYDTDQFQAGLSATYYPFGNHVFYGRTGATYFSQVGLDNFAEDRILFNQMLGFKLSKKTWLEGEFYSGNLNNANIKQAAIVYNLPDKINYTLGINLHIFVNQHLSVHLMYDYYSKSGYYNNNAGDDDELNEYITDYQTHNIIGGIKWVF